MGGFGIFAYPMIQKLRATNVPRPELMMIFKITDFCFNGANNSNLFF